MARKRPKSDEMIRQFDRLPTAGKIGVVVILFALLAYLVYVETREEVGTVDQAGPPGTKLFCFWNVENLFDDEDDPKFADGHEDWFARDPAALGLKINRLVEAITSMNDGAGPDILAMCEVESERALEMLRVALNAKLGATGFADQTYEQSAFIKNNTGRRFAPAVLSRLPIENNRVKRFGRADGGRTSARTLRVPVRYNGHELVILVSHWTSRVTDQTGDRRKAYADDTYGEYKATMLANPEAAVIVCGDFNDEFEDPSIRHHLRATTARDTVLKPIEEPWMLALSADVDTLQIGTLTFQNKFQVFDHILVSRGLLNDEGWTYREQDGGFQIYAPNFMRDPAEKLRGPLRFGNEGHDGERGYSDHFPVTVRLHVEGPRVASAE